MRPNNIAGLDTDANLVAHARPAELMGVPFTVKG